MLRWRANDGGAAVRRRVGVRGARRESRPLSRTSGARRRWKDEGPDQIYYQGPGGWSAIRPPLTTWEKPALITLIKELYDAAAVNRDLIQARVLAGENDGELLEKYRRKIEEQFFPARGFGKLKLGEARRAIRDYRKVTNSIPGTAELLMNYVENGTRFTREYGNIDEGFYNSIESALVELATLLRGKARGLYSQFAQRLATVEQMSDGIGWGFCDSVADIVGSLEEELSDS